MGKIFFRVGNSSTQSVNPEQIALVLLPETRRPAVVPTYSRQLYPGINVLLQLGSPGNILSAHILPRLRSAGAADLEEKRRELANMENRLNSLSLISERAQVFLAFLSARGLIDRRLYPLVDKVHKRLALTNKDLNPLVDMVYGESRKSAAATASHKQKIRDYLQNGAADPVTFNWLARHIDPVFYLPARREALGAELRELERQQSLYDERKLAGVIEKIVQDLKSGIDTPAVVGELDIRHCLTEDIGVEPRARFFAEIGAVGAGLNKQGGLVVERAKNFLDVYDRAPRFIALDKFSRVVTALDRTLAHVVVAFADVDQTMKELCGNDTVHSGLLVRGLIAEDEAVRTLYPIHTVGIAGRPDLNDALINHVREAYESGALAQICAPRFGLSAEKFAIGLERAVAIQRKILPLLPLEVHRIADAMETRIRLSKFGESVSAAGAPPVTQQQAVNLRLAVRAQELRHKGLRDGLKADFYFDPAKLFQLDDFLLDRIKWFYGAELEFMRAVLEKYLEKSRGAHSDGGESQSGQRSA